MLSQRDKHGLMVGPPHQQQQLHDEKEEKVEMIVLVIGTPPKNTVSENTLSENAFSKSTVSGTTFQKVQFGKVQFWESTLPSLNGKKTVPDSRFVQMRTP